MDFNVQYMTSAKLFTTVFDEEMKGRGFKRKGHCYYRLVGDYLQGVSLKPINPYSICFHVYPYWSSPMKIYCEEHKLNKGYWTEFGMQIWPERLFGGYYVKENVECNYDAMLVSLEVAKRHFLPIIESVVDHDSYIRYKTLIWPERQFVNMYMNEFYVDSIANKYKKEVELREITPTIRLSYAFPDAMDQYVYLYKSFVEESFEKAHEVLMTNTEVYLGMHPRDEVHYRRAYDNLTGLFTEKMNANDLFWIEKYRSERKEIMIPRLKNELSIIV